MILAGFAGALAILFLVAAGWRGIWQEGRASLLILLIGVAAAPAGLVLVLISGRAELGDVRVSLRGIETPFSKPVTAGGDATVDTVVVARRDAIGDAFHQSGLVLAPTGAGGDVVYRLPPSAGAAGVVDWRPTRSGPFKEPWRRMNTVDVGVGDSICLPARSGKGSGSQWRRVEIGRGHLLVHGAEAAATPGLLRLPWLGWGEIFPLSVYGAAKVGDVSAGPLAASRTFLWREPKSLQLKATLLDAGAFVAPGDCAPETARKMPTPPVLREGAPIDLALLTLHVGDNWSYDAELGDDGKIPPIRLADRRGVTVSLAPPAPARAREVVSRVLRIDFNTPEAQVLKAADIRSALPPGREGRIRLFLAPASKDEGGGDAAHLTPVSLGDKVLGQLPQRIEIDRQHRYFFLAGDGEVSAPHLFGGEVRLGQEIRARVGVERIDARWRPVRGLVPLALAALAAAAAATWTWRRSSPYAFIILTLADFLLTMRVIVAVEGAVIDPRPVTAATAPAAIFALALVPYILGRLAPAHLRSRPSVWVGQVLVIAAIAAHLWFINGGVRLMAYAPLVVVALAATAWSWWRQAAAPAHLASSDAAPDRFGRRDIWLIAGTLGVMVALRLIPERFFVGGNVSTVYTPLMVLFWAYVIARFAGQAQIRWVLAGGVLLGAPLAASFLRDAGYSLVYLAPLLALGIVVAIWRPVDGDPSASARRAYALPALAIVGLLVAVQVIAPMPKASDWPQEQDMSSKAREARHAQLAEAVDESRWTQRFLMFRDPAAAAGVGTSSAEGQRLAKHSWTEFASQGLGGRGYLQLPEPGELRRYHLSDNLAAVHLLAPFGRAGGAAFLLALGAAAAGVTLRMHADLGARGVRWLDLRDAAGLAALWTIFGASAYMILANINLTPFTGRNVLMLSAYSPSDLLEGLVLLGISAWSLGWRA